MGNKFNIFPYSDNFKYEDEDINYNSYFDIIENGFVVNLNFNIDAGEHNSLILYDKEMKIINIFRSVMNEFGINDFNDYKIHQFTNDNPATISFIFRVNDEADSEDLTNKLYQVCDFIKSNKSLDLEDLFLYQYRYNDSKMRMINFWIRNTGIYEPNIMIIEATFNKLPQFIIVDDRFKDIIKSEAAKFGLSTGNIKISVNNTYSNSLNNREINFSFEPTKLPGNDYKIIETRTYNDSIRKHDNGDNYGLYHRITSFGQYLFENRDVFESNLKENIKED